MMASSSSKFSGGKLALHSDLRAGAGPGDAIRAVRRPAASNEARRLRSTAAREDEVVPQVGAGNRPVTRSVAASLSRSAHRRGVPGRPSSAAPAGVQTLSGIGLRAVRIHLVRCDATLRPGIVAPAEKTEIRPRKLGKTRPRRTLRPTREIGTSSASSSAYGNTPAPAQSKKRIASQYKYKNRKPQATRKIRPSGPAYATATTGIRILQLNAQHSAAVTGEVRQLVAGKRLDVLCLQEPYATRQGSSYAIRGLGTGVRVAATSSQYPWAAVAVCNPSIEMIYVSQLSNPHCTCVEVLAPGLSFYAVSCYFQYSDDIEGHLRHLEGVLRTLRGKRLVVCVDSNSRSSLWGPQSTDERGALFEGLIREFRMEVVNVAGQPATYWTARGSSFIDVTLASPSMARFVANWTVRCDWTNSDHNAVDITLRSPKAARGERSTTTTPFDTRRADWEQYAASLADLSR